MVNNRGRIVKQGTDTVTGVLLAREKPLWIQGFFSLTSLRRGSQARFAFLCSRHSLRRRSPSPAAGEGRVLFIGRPLERVVPDVGADAVEVGVIPDDMVVEAPLPEGRAGCPSHQVDFLRGHGLEGPDETAEWFLFQHCRPYV